MRNSRNRIFELYEKTYAAASNSNQFRESGSSYFPFREMAPAQPQVQPQVQPQTQALPYNAQIDEDDEIPAMEHPSRHPAVQSSHAAFVVAHDALADDPTPENLEIFLQTVDGLTTALRSYVFGESEEMDEEEVDPEEEGEEFEEEEAEEEPEEEEEDEEEEEAPPQQRRKESSPYLKSRAQSDGVDTMNNFLHPEDLDVVYDSTLMDPWVIRSGMNDLGSFSSKEEAEDALAYWSSQSQDPMPMSGMEDEYSEFLLPDAPDDIDVSADSVMGGEEQDFRPPSVFSSSRVLESSRGGSHIIEYGDMGEVRPFNPSPSPSIRESSSPEDYFKATSRNLLEIESSYDEPEPSYDDTSFFRESENEDDDGDSGLPKMRLKDSDEDDDEDGPAEIRESSCPGCSGLGCGVCGSTGRVTAEMEEILQESINQANNEISNAIGSNHFWHDKSNNVQFYGTYQPEPTDDPMIAAYDEIALARSRR